MNMNIIILFKEFQPAQPVIHLLAKLLKTRRILVLNYIFTLCVFFPMGRTVFFYQTFPNSIQRFTEQISKQTFDMLLNCEQ
jgi:hypothetical protein